MTEMRDLVERLRAWSSSSNRQRNQALEVAMVAEAAAALAASSSALPISRMVRRFGCPFCGKTGSAKARIMSHINRCWKNPFAQSCGTCEHHIPPESGESPDWFSGYPGSPSTKRACDLDIDNATEMPRGCARWTQPADGALGRHSQDMGRQRSEPKQKEPSNG